MDRLCSPCKVNYLRNTDCKQWRTQVRNICPCSAFPGTLVQGDTDGDSRRSNESQELVYEESEAKPPPSHTSAHHGPENLFVDT